NGVLLFGWSTAVIFYGLFRTLRQGWDVQKRRVERPNFEPTARRFLAALPVGLRGATVGGGPQPALAFSAFVPKILSRRRRWIARISEQQIAQCFRNHVFLISVSRFSAKLDSSSTNLGMNGKE